MSKFLLALIAFGLLAFTLFAAAGLLGRPSRVHALTNCDTSEEAVNAAEEQMLGLINDARAQAGMPPLKLSPNLDRAAAWKSADSGSNGLGTGFSHTDSLGRDVNRRARECGYGSGMAENIAYGSTSAATIFNMWMGSPGHRANINGTNLDGSVNNSWYGMVKNYRVIGIGQHGAAWTTDFGSLDDSGSTILPTNPVPTNTPTPPIPTATKTAIPTSTPTTPPTATATPRPSAGVTMTLFAGMNLVTYAGQSQAVGPALSSLGGAVNGVYEWNNAADRWEHFAPGGPGYANSFTSLEPGRVYYIELSTSAQWSY